MHHGHPSRLGPLVDTKGSMLYHCGDGEIRCESRGYMDEVHVERRLAAILVADIAGYSRLMAEDEAATVATLKGHQAVVLPLVEAHGGRIQDTAGDGILAEFRSVQQAPGAGPRPRSHRAGDLDQSRRGLSTGGVLRVEPIAGGIAAPGPRRRGAGGRARSPERGCPLRVGLNIAVPGRPRQ